MSQVSLQPLGQCQGQVQRRIRGSGRGCETWPLAGITLPGVPQRSRVDSRNSQLS